MSKVGGVSMVLHKVEDSTRTKHELENKLRQVYNCKQYVIAQEPYVHVNPNTGLPQEGSHFHVFLQFRSKCYMNSIYGKLSQWWDGGQMKMVPLRGRLAQGCKYLMKDQGHKDKSYDPHPIIKLEIDQAEEVGVEPEMVPVEQLIEFRCTKGCPWTSPWCPCWFALEAKHRAQNPSAPRTKIK
jgi:hypothetical protein